MVVNIIMTADISILRGGGGIINNNIMGRKGDKGEVIHSGHFMVSDFEAEAQDDEENVLLEIPGDTYDGGQEDEAPLLPLGGLGGHNYPQQQQHHHGGGVIIYGKKSKIETLSIDSSLTKLFNAMSICYRHKITSPKWNRFKGLKLRWKDKIRLNNIIWRCWHMQFIRKKRMTVCQFALDVDIHNKPEAIVLEGKYWKRQLDAVTAEYKKWRIYYKNKISGRNTLEPDASLFELEGMDFTRTSGLPASLEDGDLNEFMDFTDVLFNSLINNHPSQPFAFPNPREIARGTGNSDFIQPGLIQLQPNLDDFMDIVEPLQEMLAGRGLAPVPEEGDLLGLAEVAEAPELPPPPQITNSTSSPSSLQYTARLTTASAFTPTPGHSDTASTFLQQTSPTHTSPARSKPLHHHQEVPQQQLYHQQEVQLQQQQQHQQVVVTTLPSQSPPLYQSGIQLLQQQSHTPTQQQLHQPLSPTQQQLHQPLTPPQQLHQPLTPPQQLHTPTQQLHQQPHTPPQQLQPHQPQTSPQQLHQQTHTSSQLQPHSHHHQQQQQQQQQPRSFIRSHSQHELGSNHQAPSQQQPSFVIPKSLPRRRSHSSGGSSSSNNTNNSGNVVVGASSLSPHQVITTLPITSLPVTSLTVTSIPISTLPVTSLPLSPATSLPHIAPAPSTTLPHIAPASSLPHIAPATSTATSTSNFLAQLLNSGTYQVSSSDGGGQLGTLKTNLMAITNKVPLVLPAEVVTSNSSSGGSSSSSTSSSSSSSGTCSSIKPVVTTALVAPPITLNAVTPSMLKSEHSFSQAMSTWSPSFPHGTSKQSPPHQEPSSPLMVNIPSPPNKAFRVKSESDRVQYKEHRRVCHINAEQKRRSNLKSNFDVLHQLIPSISQNSNAKISKALMLQKGAEYIHQLKSERQQLTEKADQLRAEIEALSNDISNSQAQLPATGAPMTHARYSKLKEMFVVYVRERTLASWKFYIFSLITEPLLESFNSSVSTSCLDDLCRSSLAWLDQQCSLNVLRPYVSSAMRKLSTTTSVLADPESLPEEVYRSVTKQETDRYHPR